MTAARWTVGFALALAFVGIGFVLGLMVHTGEDAGSSNVRGPESDPLAIRATVLGATTTSPSTVAPSTTVAANPLAPTTVTTVPAPPPTPPATIPPEVAEAEEEEAPAPTSDGAEFLACTRAHESDTAGGYRASDGGHGGEENMGAYQFSQSTWDATAEHAGRSDLIGVRPDQASPADQDALALELYEWQGSAPWGGRC